MKRILQGNEAIARGAWEAGVTVGCAYPGTPSSEILARLSEYDDVYTEWSPNEKVSMEVGHGASVAGGRVLVCMKHVGLNVAADPFMEISYVGVKGGMVVAVADDPGQHSSQNEQDTRQWTRFGKVPLLEPADSQECKDLTKIAFDISEKFDTPVMVRTTTRISHSKSVVKPGQERTMPANPLSFHHNVPKYVMLPAYARLRRPLIEERLVRLAAYAETFPLNRVIRGERRLGVVTGGVAYQYAMEVFPKASFLKLGMTYPLPRDLLHSFAAEVGRLIVIEELDPFLQEIIQSMGIKVSGKEFIPRIGELNSRIVEDASRSALGSGQT